MTREITSTLPSLDQTLEHLHEVECRTSYDARVAQTKNALDANDRFLKDRARVDTYLSHLQSKNMFAPVYGMGNFPNAIPIALPPYLMDILIATSQVLCAQARKNLKDKGPQYLVDRLPKGWATDRMAELLYDYSMTHEPDMGFDVLVYGKHSVRGTTYDEFRKSGDWLHAKLLEAQSVDTYFGWIREYFTGARKAGCAGYQLTWARGADGGLLSDYDLYREVAATLNCGFETEVESICFLEVEPEKQPSASNLVFMADAMCAGRTDPKRRPVILDPSDLEVRGDQLFVTKPGLEREIKKVINRIVDVDLQSWIKNREAKGEHRFVEQLKRIYDMPHRFPDLSKHLCGFYLIDKSSLTDMSLLGSVSIAPKTEVLTEAHVEKYRENPELLHQIAIKPLHGMSAMGVNVGPTLGQLEEAMANETMLQQETIWATPIQPCLTPQIPDPDVQAGICSEARLVLQAGSPAVAHNPYGARVIAGLSRCHFQSKDPERRIQGDSKGRGWYSNMGAIIAVKAELGLSETDDVGIGMSPIYCVE